MKLDHARHSTLALLQGMARQERQAFETFYDRYAPTTYNLIIRIVRDSTLADDIIQEIFWQIWKKAAEFTGEGAAVAWLFRIARNKSFDALHLEKTQAAQRSQPAVGLGAASAEESAKPMETHYPTRAAIGVDEIFDVAYEILSEINHAYVYDALQVIPEEQRRCLELAYFEGMSQQQMAEYLEIPLGTVKTRLRMSLAKLEYILRGLGYRKGDV